MIGAVIGAVIGFATGGSVTRLAATLLVGAAMGGTVAHQVHRAISDRAEVQRQRATLQAIEAAQAETTRLQEQADHAAQEATKRIQVNARAAAGARSELDRLRNAIGANPADAAACPATAERAASIGAVQRECAAVVERLGRQADAHAADALRLWEAWPRLPE